MDIKFQGSAKNGSIRFNDRESVVTFLESIDGKNLTVIIKEVKSVRSLGWNSYYWAVVVPHVKTGLVDVGYEADELDNEIVHEYLKNRFLKKEIFSEMVTDSLSVTERTSKIDNVKFKDYVQRIQRWAIEFLHVYIPDPNEHQNGIGGLGGQEFAE